MGNTQTAIDGVSSAVTLGVLPFPVPPTTVIGIASVAALLKATLSGNGMSEEEARQIHLLHKKLDQLSYVIRENNANLRKLIVEHEFTYNVIIEVETMEHLMRDVLKYRTRQSMDSFHNFCKRNDPHHLVIKILRRLNHDVTNPLITAMEADKLRTKKTFDTWKNTIHNLLGTLQMAHAFYESLDTGRLSWSEPMQNAIEQVEKRLDQFIADYKPNYWPHCVQQLMRETADRTEGWNYGHIANTIRDELNRIYTTDEFYVIVYNPCSGYGRHAFLGNHVAQFRHRGANIVVARSTTVHWRSDGEKNHMSWEVTKWAKPEHIVVRGDNGMQASRDHIKNAIPHCGFVGLIELDQNVHLSWTGGSHLEPGRWAKCRRYEEYESYRSGIMGIPYSTGRALRLTSDVMVVVGFN